MRILSKRALFFCQVFAGFPLKYTPETARESRLVFSPAVYWWGFIMTLLQLGILCFECCMRLMSCPSILLPDTDSKISLFAMSIIFGSSLFMGVVLFTSYARAYPEFLKICTFLKQFDKDLQSESLDYRSTENVTIIIISTATPIVLGTDMLYSISLKEDFNFVVRRIMVYFAMTTANFTYCIAKRFRLVNARIKLLVINESLRRSVLHHRNPSCVDRRQDYTSCKNFKTLLSGYHLLCDAVYKANAFYGYQILVCIFNSFLRITENFYFFFIYEYIIGGNAVICAIISGWIFSDATFLVLIALCGSHVPKMAGGIAPLVRKLINKNVGSGLGEELKSSFLQLASLNVEFTACSRIFSDQ
ncbi:hypothetical protein J6590_101220 [Homalodisca vitripennis]|nr:hypothetical protein J6590_047285 [Homalodisca vitripennis]KAG8265163.1 hypothetical protein J6590_101220 [Homalodisca vitripennis]